MPRAQQPTLDGTLPQPTPDYHTWTEEIRPHYVAACQTGDEWTCYQIAEQHNLPNPPNPRADWGNFVQSLVRDGLAELVRFERSRRPSSERSAVAVWRGTRAAQQGRAA
jgi:hypothetical protein